MKYVHEFRDRRAAQHLVSEIRSRLSQRWVIMDVCGGQTHGLLRYGIEQALEGGVQLIHGPGCPVCVTPARVLDWAGLLAQQPKVILATFGDMLRVPGSQYSLQQIRSLGGSVQPVYSPMEAVAMAQANQDRLIVFLAVGFETTTPATALAVLQAERLGLRNFTILSAHVRVLPAMRSIAASEDNRVQAFLAAGHVCTVTGLDGYPEFVREYGVPVVVTGFEPVDLLQGISRVVHLLEDGQAKLENCYARNVAADGNRRARQIVDEVYEVCDSHWRGMGCIAQGGLGLRDRFKDFDATRRFAWLWSLPSVEPSETCRSGEVLTGKIKPQECAAFGSSCTPDSPLGAPMVSSEGACAAYYRYAAVADKTIQE